MTLFLELESAAQTGPASRRSAVVEAGGSLTIGRGAQAGWVLQDPGKHISAIHCVIESTPRGFVLTDKSTNGTFVNGSRSRIEETHVLAQGDRVQIGPFVIGVSLAAGARPSPASEKTVAPGSAAAQPPAAIRRGGDPAAVAAVAMASAEPSGASREEPAPMTVVRPFTPEPREQVQAPRPAPAPSPLTWDIDTAATHSRTFADAPQRVTPAAAHWAEAKPAMAGESPAGHQLETFTRALVAQVEAISASRREALRDLGSRRDYLVSPARRSLAPGKLVVLLSRSIAADDDATPALGALLADEVRHHRRLLSAVRVGAARVAALMSPPGPGTEDDPEALKRWMADYRSLWDGLGGSWEEGFSAALAHQIAAAYDQSTDE